MPVPDPYQLHPTTRPDLTNIVFLSNQITSEFIEVGNYTYYDDEGWRGRFENTNVLYNYGPQRLILGRFSAIGPGAQFLMPGGEHSMIGPSTYPFTMFGDEWTDNTLDTFRTAPLRKDTVIGNDVWIGREATIMPSVIVGDGAVIATRSVVTKDVAPYTVVGGNPAQLIRSRYTPQDVQKLLTARWWDWSIEAITYYSAAIMGGTPQELATIAVQLNE